jgi:hypothetical protein
MQYSGILAIVFAWGFVTFPALISIDSKKYTISEATKKKTSRIVIGFGLVIGAFLQFLFLLYITEKFTLSSYDIGHFLYLLTNIATVLVAIFTIQKATQIHTFLVCFYFICHPVALVLVGLSTHDSIIKLISTLLMVLYCVGNFILWNRYRKQNAYMEQWAFLILSIWVLYITFV